LQDRDPALAKELTAQGGDLFERDDYGGIPMHYAAALGCVDLMQDFLRLGVPVDTENRLGWMPIRFAMESGQFEAARFLWQHQRAKMRNDDSVFLELLEELCSIGVDATLQPGEAWSGFFQRRSQPDEKYTKHPRVIELGRKLHELGGFQKMKEAAKAIERILGRRAVHELSCCWHGVGHWLH
jgi:hypothetical protein